MPFDLSTAKPLEGGGFDLASARPVGDPREAEVPRDTSKLGTGKKDSASDAADDLVGGALEGIPAVASGIVGQGVGNLVGLVRSITSGKFGTQEGVEEGGELAAKVREAMTYQPRGELGKGFARRVGDMLGDSKLEGLNPGMGVPMPPVREALRAGTSAAGKGAARVGDLLAEGMDVPTGPPPRASMPGVGAAETDLARMRRETAGSLPVPLTGERALTKGQAGRDFDQLRFERETAKDGKLGAPLRQRTDLQNEAVLQNLHFWVDDFGAEAPDLRGVGRAVDEAVVEKAKAAKAKINAAYDKARKSGAMGEMIPMDDVVAYLEQNRPAAINAGVLSAAEQKLSQLGGIGADGKPRAISINDLEELRKFVGKMGGKDATNATFAKDLKEKIDAATEGRGGEAYKEARALRVKYAREFEDRSIVDRLLSKKPGTQDRSVALEDVFDHSIRNSSYDDIAHLKGVLEDAGPKGVQAWKELQGQTVNYLREQATKGVQRDSRQNPIISPSGLDKAVRELDRDGKLELIFGKQTAQQIRDLNDIAKDVYTVPKGVENTSGTSAVLLQALRELATGHFSVGTAKALGVAKQAWESRKLRSRVRDALDDPTIRELSDEERGMRVGDLMEKRP